MYIQVLTDSQALRRLINKSILPTFFVTSTHFFKTASIHFNSMLLLKPNKAIHDKSLEILSEYDINMKDFGRGDYNGSYEKEYIKALSINLASTYYFYLDESSGFVSIALSYYKILIDEQRFTSFEEKKAFYHHHPFSEFSSPSTLL